MTATFTIEVLEECEIDAELDNSLRKHLMQCFPDSPEKFLRIRLWHNTPPIFTVISCDEHGHVIGHVSVVMRTITTTWNWRYNVASIQGVSVSPEHRSHGIAQQLLERALQEALKHELKYAILFCKESLISFYQKLGWRLTDDSVIMRNQEDNPIKMRSNCPMFKELTSEPFPEGPVDVHNPEQVGMMQKK